MINSVGDSDYLFELIIHSTKRADKRKYLYEFVNRTNDIIAALRNEVNSYKDALNYIHGYTISNNGKLCESCTTYNRLIPIAVTLCIATTYCDNVIKICVVISEWKSIYRYRMFSKTSHMGELQAIVDATHKLPQYVSIREIRIESEYVLSFCNKIPIRNSSMNKNISQTWSNNTSMINNIPQIDNNISHISSNVSYVHDNIPHISNNTSHTNSNIPHTHSNMSHTCNNTSYVYNNSLSMDDNIMRMCNNMSLTHNNILSDKYSDEFSNDVYNVIGIDHSNMLDELGQLSKSINIVRLSDEESDNMCLKYLHVDVLDDRDILSGWCMRRDNCN